MPLKILIEIIFSPKYQNTDEFRTFNTTTASARHDPYWIISQLGKYKITSFTKINGMNERNRIHEIYLFLNSRLKKF
jgi:hypothetical protein